MHIRNPRTGFFDYEITPPLPDEIADRIRAMRVAQAGWKNGGIEGRIAAMQAWKQAFLSRREAIIDAITVDTGRWSESVQEVDLVLKSIDRWCGLAHDFFAPASRRTSSIPFLDIQQDVVPYAVVGVISPWNFPLLLSVIDTIPALLAGCSVVVKPSEITPRFIRPLLESIQDVPVLASVFTYLEGGGETGATLVDQCDLICFTGSTATGKKVYRQAAERFIPVFLELGGKDAALVFADADLERATSALLWGSVVNAGQSCLSIERIYVHESIYDNFLQRLVEKAGELALAYPSLSAGQIGPIISDKQVAIIDAQLRDALAKGAKVVLGKQACVNLGGGFYLPPTILTRVTPQMAVMTEETFGPIMPVSTFRTENEAIKLANSTSYGLSGAIFSASQERAMRVAGQLHCGAVSLNDAALTAIMHEGEKNAFNLSGIGGTRMGSGAIRRFMRQKVYLIKNKATDSPWWF